MEFGFGYNYVALITLLTVLLLFFMSANVGKLRSSKNIKAPAMTGDNELECAIRVHMNSIEQAMLFLPSLWICAASGGLSDENSAILGVVWLVGRVVYMRSYMKDAAARGPGFLIGLVATVLLWGISVKEIVTALL